MDRQAASQTHERTATETGSRLAPFANYALFALLVHTANHTRFWENLQDRPRPKECFRTGDVFLYFRFQ